MNKVQELNQIQHPLTSNEALLQAQIDKLTRESQMNEQKVENLMCIVKKLYARPPQVSRKQMPNERSSEALSAIPTPVSFEQSLPPRKRFGCVSEVTPAGNIGEVKRQRPEPPSPEMGRHSRRASSSRSTKGNALAAYKQTIAKASLPPTGLLTVKWGKMESIVAMADPSTEANLVTPDLISIRLLMPDNGGKVNCISLNPLDLHHVEVCNQESFASHRREMFAHENMAKLLIDHNATYNCSMDLDTFSSILDEKVDAEARKHFSQ